MERKEIWKDIEGYEGLYKVSSWGRVKSLERTCKRSDGRERRVGERIMKPYRNKKGYLRASLTKNGIRRLIFVHRLVAEAFIDNPKNLPEVNHINEVKDDNRVENLEWITHLDNVRFGTGLQRRINKQFDGKHCKPIVQLTLDGRVVKVWLSAAQANRFCPEFLRSSICVCAKGRRDSYKGYKWQYAEDMMRPFRENKSET